MSDPTSAEAGSARLAKALNTYATNRTDRTASTSSSDDTSNHLLYTPSLFSSSFDAKPKNLLAADVPTTYGTHPSSEIYEALASHSRKMTEIEKELIALSSNPDAQKGDTTFNGHTGAEVAQALADYAKSHPGEGLPSDFEGEQEGLSQAAKLHNLLAAGVGASAGTGTVLAAADGTADSAFSCEWRVYDGGNITTDMGATLGACCVSC